MDTRQGEPIPETAELKAQCDALFANDREAVKQVRQPKQLAYALAKVKKLKAAAFCLGRDHQANQCAQPHAVHMRQIGEIENDAPMSRESAGRCEL